MIPQKTKEILSRVKSPSVEDILKGSMRGYNSYDSNKHNESRVNMEHMEELCYHIYVDWYNHFTKNRGRFATKELNDLAERLFNDKRFLPENIANLKSKHKYPFYTFFKLYEKTIGSKIGNPTKFQSMELSDNHDSMNDVDFLHVFGYSTTNKKRDKIEARLYLNLKSKNSAQFAIEAYKKCKEKNLPFYYKLSSADDRNDTFLFYVSYDHMPEYIEVIEEIKQEHPELFEGSEKTSKNFGTINGYIGYGEEPVIRDPYGDKYSFNSLRNSAIDEMKTKLEKQRVALFPEKRSNSDKEFFATHPQPLSYDDCIDFFVNNIINKRKEFQNCSPKELKRITESLKNQLMRQIKNNVLNNTPLRDITITVNGNQIVIPVNEKNIYSALERCTGKKFIPYRITGMKAHLTRFLVFSSASSLTENEQKLCQIVKKALVRNIEKFISQCTDNDLRTQWTLWLEDVKGTPKNERGKNYIMLATAQFIETGKISAYNPTTSPLVFDSEEIYEVYDELLGKDTIRDLIDTTCEKYGISNNNFCLNASTEKELSASKRM